MLGPSAWWDAAQLTGLSDGDPVGTLTDASGNGKNATGATTARPTYKMGIINSKPVLRFDGVDDKLSFAAVAVQEAYVVCNYTGGALFADYSGLLTFASTTSAFRGEYAVRTWRSNGGVDGMFGSNIRVNGALTNNLVTLSAFAISDGFSASGINLDGEIGHDYGAAARFWAGDVAEIICFGSTLSVVNRTLLRAYLSVKYNITVA